MKKLYKRLVMLVLFIATNCMLFAQDKPVEMADVMRSNGKIYIVVAICLLILIGLFIYVWNVDRKISRLENNNN